MNPPYILLNRDPLIEAMALKYISSTPKDVKHCFICGLSGVIISPDKEQITLFKKILNPRKKNQDGDNSNTCSECMPLIFKVFFLHQQICALQNDLKKVVDSAKAKSRRDEGEEFVADIVIKTEAFEDVFVPELCADSDMEMDFCGGGEELDNFEDLILVPDTALEPKVEITRPSRKSKIKAEQLLKSVITSNMETSEEEEDDEYEDEKETGQFKNEVGSDCDYDSEKPSNESEPEDVGDRDFMSSSVECDVCNKIFKCRKNLLEHIRFIHNKERNHKCPKEGCSSTFTKAFILREHLVNVHNEYKTILGPKQRKYKSGEKIKCEICSKEFSRRGYLTEHIRFVHNKEKNFHCPLEGCNTSFGKRHKLEVHIKLHDKPKKVTKPDLHKKIYYCKKCNKAFSKRKTCFYHQIQVCAVELTPDEMQLYQFAQCPLCPLQFENVGKLERHDRFKHNSAGTLTSKLICSKGCGKAFSEKYHLLVHEATICGTLTIEEFKMQHALDSKRLKCPSCSKQFLHQETLDSHLLTHDALNQDDGNEKEGNKTIICCEECGKTYTGLSMKNCMHSLRKHKARVHLRERRFICSTCGWKFFSATDLRRHERLVHSQRATFDCEKCGTAFKLKFALQNHNKTRPNCNDGSYKYRKSATDDKPQLCTSCGEQFTRKSHLSKHLRDNHPDLWDWEKRKSKFDLELESKKEREAEQQEDLDVEYLM